MVRRELIMQKKYEKSKEVYQNSLDNDNNTLDCLNDVNRQIVYY